MASEGHDVSGTDGVAADVAALAAETENDSYAVAATGGSQLTAAVSDNAERWFEEELAMVFSEEETARLQRRRKQQVSGEEDSDENCSSGSGGFQDYQGLTDRLLSGTVSQHSISAVSQPDIFRCTLPVFGRHTLEMEAKGINAARRKQRRMVMCSSDSSTASSAGTTNQSSSADTGNACGCFHLWRIHLGVQRQSPINSVVTSSITFGCRSAVRPGNKTDRKPATSLFTQDRREGCPPSAVQTFSFADTKIGNAVSAVSATDGGLVVRVNSCRGGQHVLADTESEVKSATGDESDSLSLFVDGRRGEAGRQRWTTATRSSGPESDSTGNFTLVPRRCTEVRRAIGWSRRKRILQTVASPSDHSSSTGTSERSLRGCGGGGGYFIQRQTKQSLSSAPAISSRCLMSELDSGEEDGYSPAISSAAGAVTPWKRLVAGLETVAGDGRRLLANCRLTGGSFGGSFLGLTTFKSYNLLTGQG